VTTTSILTGTMLHRFLSNAGEAADHILALMAKPTAIAAPTKIIVPISINQRPLNDSMSVAAANPLPNSWPNKSRKER
jgi:hypothetical protein